MAPTGAPTTFNSNPVSDVFVMTHTLHNAQLADNVFKGNPFQAHLQSMGRVNHAGGADLLYEIEVVDDAGLSQTVNVSGAPATFTPVWKEISLPVRYDWKMLVGGVVIGDAEAGRNKGEAQIMNLVERRFKNLEKELKQKLETMLVSATAPTGGLAGDFHSLGQIVGTGALGGLVGGTSANQVKEWQSVVPALRKKTNNNDSDPDLTVDNGKGRSYISRLVRSVTRGGGETPDLILTNGDTFARIEEITWDKVRLTGGHAKSSSMTELKFDNFMFGQALVMWTDNEALENDTTKKNPIYVLNTDYLELVCNSNMWMKLIGPTRDTVNLADSFVIECQGNLVTDGRKFQTVTWQDPTT